MRFSREPKETRILPKTLLFITAKFLNFAKLTKHRGSSPEKLLLERYKTCKDIRLHKNAGNSHDKRLFERSNVSKAFGAVEIVDSCSTLMLLFDRTTV